jgi:hypothetical protein
MSPTFALSPLPGLTRQSILAGGGVRWKFPQQPIHIANGATPSIGGYIKFIASR